MPAERGKRFSIRGLAAVDLGDTCVDSGDKGHRSKHQDADWGNIIGGDSLQLDVVNDQPQNNKKCIFK